MKQVVFILFVSVISLITCKDRKQDAGREAAEQKAAELVQDPAKDSAEIRTVITDFYNWYDKNYAKFREYGLYSSIKKKEAPPYKMNWDAVEKYQQFIRDSVPQLGEEFIADQKHFFQQCDSAFKVDLEDDIPYGFDYDWYTNSQEDPQYLVDNINRAHHWTINVYGDNATVDVKANFPEEERAIVIKLAMKKEQGNWKIAKIGIE